MPERDLPVNSCLSAPIRTCIGCGRRRPKTELVRLVLGACGQAAVDSTGRHRGRGAYVCGRGCVVAAVKRRALQRAFRGKASAVDIASLELAVPR